MNNPRAALFAVLAIGSILAVSGCKKNPGQSSPAKTNSTSGITEVFNVTKRADRAPDFSWKDSTGATVSFDKFHDKVTLINFWATWCGPCKKELPALVEINKEFADRGVRIIGVSSDRGANVADDVRAFVRENGIPYQVIISNDDLEEAFGNIRALPTTFLVNEQGTIVKTFVGGRDKQFFSEAIASLLK
jgi:thiol-disulfide isomerase/thioredoxin